MRYILLFASVVIFTISCKKDKFTTVPQLTYKSITPSTYKNGSTSYPTLTMEITDTEGDLGLKLGKDTTFIYVKNLRMKSLDSIPFPNIISLTQKRFSATIEVFMNDPFFTAVPNTNVKDTINYEIYVKDFAKNKSNVIKCGPLYFIP